MFETFLKGLYHVHDPHNDFNGHLYYREKNNNKDPSIHELH